MRRARHQPPEHVGPEGCLTRLFLRGDLASRADTRLMHVPSFAVRVLHQNSSKAGCGVWSLTSGLIVQFSISLCSNSRGLIVMIPRPSPSVRSCTDLPARCSIRRVISSSDRPALLASSLTCWGGVHCVIFGEGCGGAEGGSTRAGGLAGGFAGARGGFAWGLTARGGSHSTGGWLRPVGGGTAGAGSGTIGSGATRSGPGGGAGCGSGGAAGGGAPGAAGPSSTFHESCPTPAGRVHQPAGSRRAAAASKAEANSAPAAPEEPGCRARVHGVRRHKVRVRHHRLRRHQVRGRRRCGLWIRRRRGGRCAGRGGALLPR